MAPKLERPDIPTLDQVEAADKEQLARWYRFLSPGGTRTQRRAIDRIVERFEAMGGMTPELSRKIGYGGVESKKKEAQPN